MIYYLFYAQGSWLAGPDDQDHDGTVQGTRGNRQGLPGPHSQVSCIFFFFIHFQYIVKITLLF